MKTHEITFTPIGGGREIGANSYLIRLDGFEILLDCGVHPKKDGAGSLPDFSLLHRAPHAVLVSHGHVDHCGALPQLLSRYPQTVPYATDATVGVMKCMLHNSVSVMTTLAREKMIRDYPLYDYEDVDFLIERACPMDLDTEFSVVKGDGVTAEFIHAGHVLGSASILLKTERHSLFYTGDICTSDQELMAAQKPIEDIGPIDTLIIESTYGANLRADSYDYTEEAERFCADVARVLERGGSVLVPSFALGRTQEMLNLIARFQDCGRIPAVPVYASGLGRAVYEVYHRYPHYLHPNAVLQPLSRFGRVGDVWNRGIALALIERPAIIVATSGMMVENTPSAMIAEEMVQQPRHGIFFVGYVDPDTLGHRVLHAEKNAMLRFGPTRPPVQVRLDDIIHFHFGAHAPRKALRGIIERVNPRNVIYVHGDPEAVDWMYQETNHGARRYSPATGDTITLEA